MCTLVAHNQFGESASSSLASCYPMCLLILFCFYDVDSQYYATIDVLLLCRHKTDFSIFEHCIRLWHVAHIESKSFRHILFVGGQNNRLYTPGV